MDQTRLNFFNFNKNIKNKPIKILLDSTDTEFFIICDYYFLLMKKPVFKKYDKKRSFKFFYSFSSTKIFKKFSVYNLFVF